MTQLQEYIGSNHLRLALIILGWFAAINSLNAVELFPGHPTAYEKNWSKNFIQDIKSDVSNYVKNDNLVLFGDTFIAAGVLANTGFDRSFAQHWQTDLKSKTTDNLFAIPKAIGGLSYYYAPIYLSTMAFGHLREHTLMGNVMYHFGYRSLRTFMIGGLQQVVLTNLLGGGRPCRGDDSKWQPFQYETAVSGHAFYGAIPFLTAAMMTDNTGAQFSLYFLSTLPGISRLNSNSHYLSQVLLGWTIAFLSARSVYQTDMDRQPAFQVSAYPKNDGAMLAARLKF
jgi:hypothetical protein